MSAKVATIDFHVTSECNQECTYCWGPQDYENPVDTGTALRIISKVKEVGAGRIVFTGGDPLKRPDVALLIEHARKVGLEVALSTTGDELTLAFLRRVAPFIDLISLPIDGASEEVNVRTKKEGHLAAVLQALEWLREYPEIDVKVCTPVTRHNLADVPNIVRLVEAYAATTESRVFYNIFQTFPRAISEVEWDELLVSDEEFATLERQLAGVTGVRINFLGHATLDRLYVMIFPDGSLVIPRGQEYLSYGRFLDVADLDAVLEQGRFDSARHLAHSRAWTRRR
ncbi:MAG: radical SAM protein [Gemmatimonadota bacterium]|nr:MAG: radical SAM protein [Gemmatimonadota bacterium]